MTDYTSSLSSMPMEYGEPSLSSSAYFEVNQKAVVIVMWVIIAAGFALAAGLINIVSNVSTYKDTYKRQTAEGFEVYASIYIAMSAVAFFYSIWFFWWSSNKHQSKTLKIVNSGGNGTSDYYPRSSTLGMDEFSTGY